jgi:hypothetical protein
LNILSSLLRTFKVILFISLNFQQKGKPFDRWNEEEYFAAEYYDDDDDVHEYPAYDYSPMAHYLKKNYTSRSAHPSSLFMSENAVVVQYGRALPPPPRITIAKSGSSLTRTSTIIRYDGVNMRNFAIPNLGII